MTDWSQGEVDTKLEKLMPRTVLPTLSQDGQFRIVSRSDWHTGLFRMADGSSLHMVYEMREPGQVRLQFVARSAHGPQMQTFEKILDVETVKKLNEERAPLSDFRRGEEKMSKDWIPVQFVLRVSKKQQGFRLVEIGVYGAK